MHTLKNIILKNISIIYIFLITIYLHINYLSLYCKINDSELIIIIVSLRCFSQYKF